MKWMPGRKHAHEPPVKISEASGRERFVGGMKYSDLQETGLWAAGSLRFWSAEFALREGRSVIRLVHREVCDATGKAGMDG